MQDGDDNPEPKEGDSMRPAGSVPPPGRASHPSHPSHRPPSLPPRPSQAPRSSFPPSPRAWLRIAFGALWIGGQVALVLTADRRPDAAFGFRMFNESSTLKASLFREIDGENGERVRVPVVDGQWKAHDSYGMMRLVAWTDRVKRPELAVFDREISASYGANAQVARFQAALDDVATHVDDVETRRFALDVAIRKNGREPYVLHLVSGEVTAAATKTAKGGGR